MHFILVQNAFLYKSPKLTKYVQTFKQTYMLGFYSCERTTYEVGRRSVHHGDRLQKTSLIFIPKTNVHFYYQYLIERFRVFAKLITAYFRKCQLFAS